MTENSFNLETSYLPIIEIYKCIQGEGPYMGVPHILIRTTGCPLRCQWGNSFCDTPYASWKPEKGSITLGNIHKIYRENPQIKHTMITGGSPTLYPELLVKLTELLGKEYDQLITLETEGTAYVEGLTNTFVSLSPKLKSSIPRPGVYTLNEKEIVVSIKDKERHEKDRANYDEMNKLLEYYGGWLKPVINLDTFEQDVTEVKEIQLKLNVDNNNVWLMPAGLNEVQLNECRQQLVEYCITEGYCYTDRLQIVIYGEKRGV